MFHPCRLVCLGGVGAEKVLRTRASRIPRSYLSDAVVSPIVISKKQQSEQHEVIYDERGYRLMRETMNKETALAAVKTLYPTCILTPPRTTTIFASNEFYTEADAEPEPHWIWTTSCTSSLGAGLTRLLAAATTTAGAPHRLLRTTTAVRTTPGDDEGVSFSFSLGACSCLQIFAYQEGDAVSQRKGNSNAHSIVLEKKLFSL